MHVKIKRMNMIKKFSLIIVALVAIVANAQVTGQWVMHPKYLGSGAANLIDAGNKVFFQSGNTMFTFDKETLTVATLDREHGASDLIVTGCYYNYDSNYLLITYNNSNIDVVRANGSVVNIPDRKDVVYNGPKAINDVTFAGGKAYLATQFGLVIIDDRTLQVVDTYYYSGGLTSAVQMGDYLFVAKGSEIYYDARKYHDNLNQFVPSDLTFTLPRFEAINDSAFFVMSGEGLTRVALDADSQDPVFTSTLIAGGTCANVQHTPTGFIANFKVNSFYYTFDSKGLTATKVSASKEFYSMHPSQDGTIWALGDNGLHIKGKTPYYTPNGEGITENAFYSAYNPGDGKFYVCRTTDNAFISKYSGVQTEIWSYDGATWRNATPVGKVSNNGNYWLAFEKGKKCSYLFSTRGASYTSTDKTKKYFGIISHVVDDTVRTQYDGRDNSPINGYQNAPITFMNAIALDTCGNLWGVQPFRPASEGPYVICLPKEKFHKPDLSVNDWVVPANVKDVTGNNKRSAIAVAEGTDIKCFTTGAWGGNIMFWDNEGDVYNTNPKFAIYSKLYDDDGVNFAWQYLRCLASDRIGNIWVGTSSGLFYLNAREAFSDNFRIHNVKINTSTSSQAAVFLEGEDIITIAVDSLNRKWIGTSTQGVYLVNAESNQILGSWDMNNSALPSNMIYSICPIPNRNSVMFVTSNGIAEFLMDVKSTVEDYSGTQAYPNPVKPDFTGMITISNLVSNSFVKITDRHGNVVATMQAQGTSVRWDGCDPTTGERHKTGTYYVYAGPTEETLSDKAVTQIRIIK